MFRRRKLQAPKLSAEAFAEQLVQLRHQPKTIEATLLNLEITNPAAYRVKKSIDVLAERVEPVDRVLGRDKHKLREKSASGGIKLGTYILQSVLDYRKGEVAIRHTGELRRATSGRLPGEDTFDAAHRCAEELVAIGSRGFYIYPGLSVPVDTLMDGLNPTIDTRLEFMVGFGLVAHIASAVSETATVDSMNEALGKMQKGKFDFDGPLRAILTEPHS